MDVNGKYLISASKAVWTTLGECRWFREVGGTREERRRNSGPWSSLTWLFFCWFFFVIYIQMSTHNACKLKLLTHPVWHLCHERSLILSPSHWACHSLIHSLFVSCLLLSLLLLYHSVFQLFMHLAHWKRIYIFWWPTDILCLWIPTKCACILLVSTLWTVIDKTGTTSCHWEGKWFRNGPQTEKDNWFFHS